MKLRSYAAILLLVAAAGCADSTLGLVEADEETSTPPNNTPTMPANNSSWSDTDGDGVVDRTDNCVERHNSGQEDADRDGVGDACDNCVNTANLNQVDGDANGIGDACEWGDAPDADGDGIADRADNCVNTPNPDQADSDLDGIGDVCDNCPNNSNPTQSDNDGDNTGNACDPDFSGQMCYSQEFSPDVTTIEPSVLIMLDASGSMADQLDPNRPKPWPIDTAVDAIHTIADNLASEARIGLSQFPHQSDVGSTCTMKEHLGVASNSASAIKGAANGISAIGNTPTGYALNSILDRGLLTDGGDPYDTRRPKGVILITDGDPTVACDTGSPVNLRVEAQPEAVAAAARLNNAGIPVYVVGFQSGAEPANLNEIAAAGGTDAPGLDRFYTANDANQLVNVVQSIKDSIVSCAYQLDNVPPNMDQISVKVDGQPIAEDANNGFTFDAFASLVTLHGAACDDIKNAPDPSQKRIVVDITCVEEDQCVPAAEVCDSRDNNCNGQVDENDVCGGDGNDGQFEVCDGVDNDGDGQVDEGCPVCSLLGDTCQTSADCCNGECSGGVCTAQCRPAEVACLSNADCCSGACSGSASSPGVCLAL